MAGHCLNVAYWLCTLQTRNDLPVARSLWSDVGLTTAGEQVGRKTRIFVLRKNTVVLYVQSHAVSLFNYIQLSKLVFQ